MSHHVARCLLAVHSSGREANAHRRREDRTTATSETTAANKYPRYVRTNSAMQMTASVVLETISLIFGSDNARLGAERLFELFQDMRLNKHLCYVRITRRFIWDCFSRPRNYCYWLSTKSFQNYKSNYEAIFSPSFDIQCAIVIFYSKISRVWLFTALLCFHSYDSIVWYAYQIVPME